MHTAKVNIVLEALPFYTLPHDSGRVLWFHVGRPCVCPFVHQSYVRPSVFCFWMITSKHQWIFTKFGMCIDIMEIWFGGPGVSLTLCCFVVYSTRRFVICLTMCHFVLVFFSRFSIAITSLGEERANLSAFRTFVRFVLVWICRFP